jgi:hypothetical protein
MSLKKISSVGTMQRDVGKPGMGLEKIKKMAGAKKTVCVLMTAC